MIVFPNAKINLGLNIISRREDGYHNIETCFYPIGWTDILEIIPSGTFAFTSSGISIPGNTGTNLCVKAYEQLKKDFDLPPVKIHLHKIVPIGAGLGGGSSDATFTIKLLNEKFSLGLSIEKMQHYARQLGSDCAFFIDNKPVFASEKGDVFETINLSLEGYYAVVLYPGIHVSTVDAYGGVKRRGTSDNLKEKITGHITAWKTSVFNDFEFTVFPKNPEIEQIKNELYNAGAEYACMSGSGSAVVGIFRNEIATEVFLRPGYLVWKGYL